MGRTTSILIKICNLRVLVVFSVLWLLIGAPRPEWLDRVNEQINQSFFRIGLYFSELPYPHTPITVIHVSDLEYDRWLVDLPGANRLLDLLNVVKGQSNTVLGLVLERPIALIQPEAESLLSEIQKGRTRKQHLYDQTNAVLERRTDLLEGLKQNQVVLGVQNQIPSHYKAIAVQPNQMQNYPAFIVDWLWPASAFTGQNVVSPALNYYPLIDHRSSSQSQFLAVHNQKIFIPTFLAQFLLASELDTEQAELGHSANEILWQKKSGFTFNNRVIKASASGAFVPIYGQLSGIYTPLRQITLGAALEQDDLTGWILVGRDGSYELSQIAQILASLGDDATLVEPLWWTLIHKMLLVVLAIFLLVIVPLAPPRWALFGASLIAAGLVTFQIGGQVSRGYWLPSGDLLIFVVAGFSAMFIWVARSRHQKHLWGRADQASLELASYYFGKGGAGKAYDLVSSCRTSEPVLHLLYEIGLIYESKEALPKAFEVYKEIRRRKRRYKDTHKKIKMLKPKVLATSNDSNAVAVDVNHDTTVVDVQLQQERVELEENSAALDLEQTQVLPELAGLKKTFGRYEIERELGRGASGTVYLGFDPLISRQVAIKTLNYNQFPSDEIDDVKARFVRESEAAGRLSHPNIVPVFDVGEEEDVAFIAMDFAKGSPLSEFITEDNLLPVFDVYRITLAIAEALDYAHASKIVHRDIKPGNILYCDDPFQVKVTDFGIARFVDHSHTRTGEILGSPLYMAPEQLLGKRVEFSADIFSLGVMFYQLLTGSLPFNGDSLASLTYEIVHNKHKGARTVRKSLPASATRITNVALQKKPGERYASASAMAEALRKAIKRDFTSEAKASGFY